MEENIDFVIGFLARHIPQIRPIRPQASFLVWLDCRQLGLNHERLLNLFVDKAHLALNDGEMFFGSDEENEAATGGKGHGFMRLNVGTQRSVLKRALNQLKAALG